jgi:hypothetical protein
MSAERPPTPWMFLGGYAAFLFGLMVSMVASMEWPAAAKSDGVGSGNSILALAFIAAGVAATAAGCLLMARAPLLTTAAFSANVILFIMTPIPALLAAGINLLGERYRKGDAGTWQVALVGIGVFLLGVAGSWAAQGLPLSGLRDDFREFAWAIVGNLGCAAVFLAALPLFGTGETSAAPLAGDSSLEDFKRLLDK